MTERSFLKKSSPLSRRLSTCLPLTKMRPSSGQLADERVQHRTFLQLEGIGIIDHGVASHIKFHLCGFHHGLVQFYLARCALHEDGCVQYGHLAPSQFLDFVGKGHGLVVVLAQAQGVFARLGEGQRKDGLQIAHIHVVHDGPFKHQRAVLGEELRLHANQRSARHVVQHLSIEQMIFLAHQVVCRNQRFLLRTNREREEE